MKMNLKHTAFAAVIAGILAAGSAAFSADVTASAAASASAPTTATATPALSKKEAKREEKKTEKKEEKKGDKMINAAGADNFTIDPVHSSIIFRVKHLDTTFVYGRFNNATGTVVWSDKHPDSISFDVTVKAKDIDTNNGKRDEDLRRDPYFDTDKYPTITFKSKSVKELDSDKKDKKDDKGTKYEVTGDLTIKDVTKTITVKFQKTGESDDPWGGHRVGGEAHFEINKQDYHVKGTPGVGDDIDLTIALEASQPKAK